uniref:Uncharacterized protein n=1 Tax=Medicago truncatula TaxID=3880 RepID=Q2HU56_MEDTR|nr:hypothetical protein MtrDRAFT_AC149211g2v2 [Medicago truncatula]
MLFGGSARLTNTISANWNGVNKEETPQIGCSRRRPSTNLYGQGKLGEYPLALYEEELPKRISNQPTLTKFSLGDMEGKHITWPRTCFSKDENAHKVEGAP